jgi:hypothetical protein
MFSALLGTKRDNFHTACFFHDTGAEADYIVL